MDCYEINNTIVPFLKYNLMMLERFQKEGPIHPLLSGREFSLAGDMGRQKSFIDDLATLAELEERRNWLFRNRYTRYLYNSAYALIITDASQKIEWVNAGFERMTGYSKEETVGRFPGFLQGERTMEKPKLKIKNRLLKRKKVSADLVNYRKDGSPYICSLTIEPIYNQNNELVNFIAIEKEKTVLDYSPRR